MTTGTKSNLLGGRVLPPLADGFYQATIHAVTVYDNEKGGYIKVNMELNDAHRRGMTWTLFPSTVGYFFSNVAEQLGHSTEESEEGISYADLSNELVEKEIKIYTNWNEEFKSRNFGFTEPEAPATPEEIALALQNI